MFNRILVFGAGALGGYFGGRLLSAGNDVTFIARGERLEALKKEGLTLLSEAGGSEHLSVRALDAPDDKYDLIIFTVKSHDTEPAAKACAAHLADGGAVLSLQNGVDNLDILASVFSPDRVAGASVRSGISVPKPGTVLYVPDPVVVIGALTSQGKHFEKPLADLFNNSAINCKITENIQSVLWEKLIWNLAFNPLSALTLATCGLLAENEHTKWIMRSICQEAAAAAAYKGVNLPHDVVEKTLALNPIYINYKTSAHQDVERNRQPEIDGLMGTVVRMDMDGVISAPVIRTIYEMAKFKFGRWFHTFPRLSADVIVVNVDKVRLSKHKSNFFTRVGKMFYNLFRLFPQKNHAFSEGNPDCLRRQAGRQSESRPKRDFLDGMKVLLIERKNEPYGWAIPGGMVDYGERIERAAVRELEEETGITVSECDIRLLGVYSDPSRDSRAHTATAVYYTFSSQAPVAADDAKNAGYFHPDNLPAMAFDHAKVIQHLVEVLKSGAGNS